ncbi:MAG: DMT family transporter [Bacteroidota bacterium]|nr:DMT family transporter [Bacteroidota bacterium]
MKRNLIYTHLYAVFSMLFWGLSYVWSKIVFEYYSPLTTVFLRLLLSSLILLAYIVLLRKVQKIRKEHVGLFFLSALFNPFLYFMGESYGLQLVSPTISAVIIATIPLFTPVVAYLFFREKLSILNIFGLLISFLGIMLMLIGRDFMLKAEPLGILYLFGAVIAAIIYTVILKKLTVHYTPLCIITYQNIIGVFYFLPLFLAFHYQEFVQVKPDARLISSLLQLAIFASSMAFIFYTVAVRNLGMSKANIYSNLIPVAAAVTSYFVLNEVFDFYKILGILVVVCGLLLSQIRKLRIYNHSKKKEIKLK